MLPNCVAEYYREQEEREDYEYEIRMRREIGYEKDNFLLKDAERNGFPVLCFGGYQRCRSCKFRSHELTTWEEDDMSAIICYNKHCKEHNNI